MEIGIKDSQRKITINKKDTTELAKQVLRIKGKSSAELSILFVGKKRIRALNKKFRKIDRSTDVLAFGQNVEEKSLCLHPVRNLRRKHNIPKKVGIISNGAGPEILGDVVICPEIAQDEIYLCLVHGILHLLGYDDSNAKNRSLMEREQGRILKTIATRFRLHAACSEPKSVKRVACSVKRKNEEAKYCPKF